MYYAETLGGQEIFLPPINEIRHSHDRIMRIISAKGQPNGGNIQPNGVSVELDKAMSSIYTAILQSLDYISICQLEYIQNLVLVDELDPSVIEAICPGTDALIPAILIFQKDVQDLKSRGTPVTEDELDLLIQKISPVEEQINKILVSKNTMIERSQKIKDDNNKTIRSSTIIAIVSALLGAAAAFVLGAIF